MPEPLPPPKPQEVSPQRRAEIHTELGAGYYERGQMDIAIEELNEAVKLDPNNAKAYNIFGLVYTVLGEDAKAEQNFQRALALAPHDPDIRQNWGWYLCTHGRAKESIPEFDAAIRNPLYKTPEIAAGQRRPVQRVVRRHQRAPTRTSGARSRSPRTTTPRCSASRRSPTGRRATRKRARWLKSMRAGDPAARSRCTSACASSASSATARRRRRTWRSCKQPLPGRRRDEGHRHGDVRVTATIPTRSRWRRQAPRPACRMAPTAGALLRRGREAAGLSLDAVAQQLKLAPRQVTALEEDDFARLPGRTFVRGFVRNYARLVRIDAETVLAALPGADAPALDSPALQPTAPTIGELPTSEHAKPGWTRWAIPLTLVAVIVTAGVYEFYRGRGEAPRLPGTPRSDAEPPDAAPAPRRPPATGRATDTPLASPTAPPRPPRRTADTPLVNPLAPAATPASEPASGTRRAPRPRRTAGSAPPAAGETTLVLTYRDVVDRGEGPRAAACSCRR